jgi:SAM-dependent methyltransferase
VGVIGLPDDRLGEIVAAIIELRLDVPISTDTEREIGQFCEENLPRYKRPAKIIFDISEDMLKVASAKVRKEGLQDRVSFRHGDICNIRDVVQAVNGVRAVVALAALVGDAACDLDPREALTTEEIRALEAGDIITFEGLISELRKVSALNKAPIWGYVADMLENALRMENTFAWEKVEQFIIVFILKIAVKLVNP